MVKVAYFGFVFFVYLCSAGGKSRRNRIPDYVPLCSRNDPDLTSCIIKSSEVLRPHLAKGIPELQLPPMEPLHISEMVLRQGNGGPLNFVATFFNSTLSGMSDYKFSHLHADIIEKKQIRSKVFLPRMDMHASYDITGRVLLLPITGNGNFTATFIDTFSDLVMQADLVERNNETYFEMKQVTMKLKIGDAKVHFDNLFGGDETLSQTMHSMLQANAREIIEELTPALEEMVPEIVLTIANRVCQSTPYDILFPDV